MKNIITSEVVVACSDCSRKAFLLLFSDDDDKKEPHEYVRILEKQASINQIKYLNNLEQNNINVDPFDINSIRKGSDFLVRAMLKANNLECYCDVLMKIREDWD